MESNFRLRLLQSGGSGLGPILFEGDSIAETGNFLNRFVETAFPPGERGNTIFAVEAGSPGFLLYEASSSAGTASISLEGIDSSTTEFLTATIERQGSLLILFGASEDGNLKLLDPRRNYLVRAVAMINGKMVSGSGRDTWIEARESLAQSFECIELESSD